MFLKPSFSTVRLSLSGRALSSNDCLATTSSAILESDQDTVTYYLPLFCYKMNDESVFQNESLDLSLEKIMYNISSYDDISNSRMPPFNLPLMMRINRLLCIVFGIPLNGLVVVVIVRSRQLWSTRNIFWLTVTFFNLLALVQAVLELAMFYLHQHGDPDGFLICKIYSVAVGCPYALLLTTLTLASADRYSALVHPQFYQIHITKTRVTWTLLIIVLIIIGNDSISQYLLIPIVMLVVL